jgi:ribosomal protein S18 acetylase RimI-like enzyme
VTDHALEAESLIETGQRPVLSDAEILQEAIRESVSTSPEAFLKTVSDVDGFSVEYWEKEIASSTWVVIQRGSKVVGIAVSRFPDREMDNDLNPIEARFIESVWIAPELRGNRMGERLVRFLFEVERKKSPVIKQFLLWVFDKNDRAIRLYKRMRFKGTGESQQCNRIGRIELKLKYQLRFNAGVPVIGAVVKAITEARNRAARRRDLRKYGVTYRILGE